MSTQKIENRTKSAEADKSATLANAKHGYRSPEVVELGRLESVQGTSYGNAYDGVTTTRSWWYFK